MTGPPAVTSLTCSQGIAGHIAEVRLYEVRWSNGRRFDSRRGVTERQAQQLMEARICDPIHSPTGILRYLKLRRPPPMANFASILAQANFTTARTANLHDHVASKRKGL